MDVGQVYFSIEANGLDKVLAQAQQLDALLNKLDGKHFRALSRDAAKAQRDLDMHEKRQAQIAEVKSRTGINNAKKLGVIQQSNDKHELANVKKIGTAYKDAVKVRTQAAESAMKTETKAATTAINGAQKLQKMRQDGEMHRLKAARAGVALRSAELKLAKQSSDIAQQASSAGEQNLASLKEMQESMETNIVRFGSRMQTLGMTLQRITQPFMDVYRGVLMTAGYKLFNTVSEGLSSGFTRYDTMKKYPKIMAAFGYSSKQAQKSIDALDQSVRGLPTGLDEIVDLAQRFTATTGDIEKGTQLAIAANNAFLASMSTDTQKYQGMMQLQDVLGGKDMQPREWNSLVSSMTPAIVKMGEKLGYTSKNMNEWIQKVRDGKVDNEEFIKTLIDIGTEGGILEKMAAESKNTWQAFFANVRNASSRMTAGILKSLDAISQAVAGKDVNQLFSETIIPGIDKLTESAQKWIKANPDKIVDFFRDLKSIDVKGALTAFADFARLYGGVMLDITKRFGAGNIVRAALFFNTLGKVLAVVGGLSKGMAGPLSRIGVYGFGGLFRFIDSMSYVGKHSKSIIAVGKHSRDFKRAADATSGMVLSWQQVASKAINVAAIGVIAWSIKEIALAFVEIGKANVNFEEFAGFAAGAATLIAEFAGLGQLLGAKGALTGIAQASRILGELEIGAIAQDIIMMAKAMNDISTVKVPKEATMKRVFDSIEGFAYALPPMSVFESIGKFFSSKAVTHTAEAVSKVTEAINSVNGLKGSLKKFAKIMFGENAKGAGHGGGSWGGEPESIVEIMTMMLDQFENNDLLKTFSKRWEASNIQSVFDSLAGMMEDFVYIAGQKINSKQIETATNNITTLSQSIAPLIEAFHALYSAELGTETGWAGKSVAERRGAGAAGKTIGASYGAQAQGFAKMMEQLYETLGYVSKMVGRLNAMKSKIDELKSNFGDNFDLSSLGNIMGAITKAFDKAGVNVGSYDLAPSNMEYINEALKYLYRALKKMNKIKGLLDGLEGSEGDFTSIGDTIGQMVSDLIAACSNAPQLQEYIDQLTEVINSIQELVDSIPPEYKKKTKVTINGTVDDKVSPKVRRAIRALQASVNAIPSSITKIVTVRLVGSAVAAGVRGAEAAMAALQNQQHGGRIYRAGGGSLRRGTDTVQAMLTPGEWVMNRHATSMLGDDVLSKLNHLDIRGALNSLSLRAGQIQSKTVNNNSTKNANITVNNYHSDGVGYSRAGRFVRAL